MSLTTIKNENGIYVELTKNKINFVSKEAEIIFDLSMKNESLEVENAELKKQLQIKAEGFKAVNEELCEYAEENEKLKTQQQEFINWLENGINKWHYNFNNIDYEQEIEEPSAEELIEEILQKYKEMIGKDINVSSKGDKDETN